MGKKIVLKALKNNPAWRRRPRGWRYPRKAMPDGQISKNLSSRPPKNISLSPSGKSALPARAILHPSKRGASRSSRTLGAGCGGRGGARDGRDWCVRRSRVVL